MQQDVNQVVSETVNEIANAQMQGKKWYESKTLWVNAIYAASAYALINYGVFISPEMQVSGLAVVNMILRKITKEPIIW